MILFDILVAVAPLSGYISQLRLIQQEKSLGTFSIDVCAILMISGILRIFFWFAEGYAINLLFQAIFIIIIQVDNLIIIGILTKIMCVTVGTPQGLRKAIEFLEMEYIRSI